MVSLYSGPDINLYVSSFHTVYSVTKLPPESGLLVIDAKSVISVVSVQPHFNHGIPGDERFFVWEKIGLSMSLLGGEEELDQDENKIC